MKLKTILSLALLATSIGGLWAQNQSVRFEHITTKNGLSINRMTSIYQDKIGYMWFGTYWGLNRFDGHEVRNYFHNNVSEEISLSNNSIIWITEGPGDLILIQTGDQLSGFDVYKEQFVDIGFLINAMPVRSGLVQKVVKDRNNCLWVIGNTYGLFKVSEKNEIVFLNATGPGVYQNSPLAQDVRINDDGNLLIGHQDGRMVVLDVDSHKIMEDYILKDIDQGNYPVMMFEDSRGGMWTYSKSETPGALYYKDKDSKPIRFDENKLGSNLVTGIVEDDLGRVVIATDHGGVSIVNLDDLSVIRLVYDPSDPSSLNHYGAVAVCKDQEGTIWVGTNKGGVSFFNPSSNAFGYHKYTSDENATFNDINALIMDRDDKVWIGSDKGGLMHLDLNTNKYQVIGRKSGRSANDIGSTTVVSVAKGKNGIWIGTYHGGLIKYDGRRYINYIDIPGKYDIPGNSAWSLYVDSRDNLWVGSLRGGALVFDKNDNKLAEFSSLNGDIVSDYITAIDEDSEGNIWLGTGYGLYMVDSELNMTRQYLNQASDPNSLTNNSVEDVFFSSRGMLWLGTQDGLSRYDIKSDSFTNYTIKDGLISNYIVSIQEGRNGDIWLGTNKGLSQLKMVDGQAVIYNYNEADGLQGDLFNQSSSAQSPNGTLAFAGANGLNIFDPETIEPRASENKIVFSGFQIHNKKIEAGQVFNGRVVLENGVTRDEFIPLKPSENSFTIGFTALNYRKPEKVIYRYKLEGFDKNWVMANSEQRTAKYTNLDPGTYTFKVQATNDINNWTGETISKTIFVSTPLWKTPMAYLAYALLGLLILYLILRIRIDRERLVAEIENEKIQAKRLHELDLMKMRFFTNIGHEFRTPLTLILTPIERIIKSAEDSRFNNEFQVIQKNAKRLLTLVNQLLDFRKMEAGQHQISLSGGDLIKFMRDIIESFSDLSRENRVAVHFESDYKELYTKFDRDKMEKVMFNLFSNAFKFTQPEGSITLKIDQVRESENEDLVRISLADTGIGISKENMEHVFARFYQSDAQSNMVNHGSGIGLSITKEFVELHKGTIWVESEVNVGTTFFVELPLSKNHQSEEVAEPDDVLHNESESVKDAMNTLNNQKYTIILVEDNADFRFYLKDNLGQYYNMLEAENGEVGYDKILRHQPDLIVSDVMMPKMNGIDMTLKLKKDRKTKHIPVILLSSHQSDTHKIEGLKAGAIDFISKPFNFEILENRIKSALSLKENITSSQKKIEVSPTEIAVTSLDEKMIQKALAIVEENMSNADFSVQELSRELGVSRAQLYKKVVSITGQSPIEFIRDIRLKRAALLLEKSQLSVSEIAYKVGFNNPRYFSNYFKEAYHVLPSKYLESKLREEQVGEEADAME